MPVPLLEDTVNHKPMQNGWVRFYVPRLNGVLRAGWYKSDDVTRPRTDVPAGLRLVFDEIGKLSGVAKTHLNIGEGGTAYIGVKFKDVNVYPVVAAIVKEQYD